MPNTIQPNVFTPAVIPHASSQASGQPKAEVKAEATHHEPASRKSRPIQSADAGHRALENAANRYDKMAGGMGW